jgi:hypothetical protein
LLRRIFVALQRRQAPACTPDARPEATDFEVFARYCDRLERREGTWRIASRQVVYDSTSTRPSTAQLRNLVGVPGRRDRDDPFYQLKRTSG